MPLAAPAQPKPDLACLGHVKSIDPAKKSSKEGSPYYSMKIVFEGRGLAPKTTSTFFTFDPAWFEAGFHPATLDRSQAFVYAKNIADAERVSALIGMLGPDKKVQAAFDAALAEVAGADGITIGGTIREFILSLGPQTVGYVLRQRKEDTGLQAYDEEGNAITTRRGNPVTVKSLTPYMDIEGFFFPDARTANYHLGRETKDESKFKMAYALSDVGA
jgi:hypothetical protein